MGDPRYPHGAPSDRAATGDSHFPGYPSLDVPAASSLASYREYGRGYLGGASSVLLREDKDFNPQRSGPYGVDGVVGHNYHPELSIQRESDIGTLATCSSMRGYSSLLDDSNPSALHMRGEFSAGPSSGIAGNGTSDATVGLNGLKTPEKESNMLLVNGLPSDCTRREVGHLFRPFIGFKEIRVIHKVARRKGDQAMVLCFVEFDNSKCAYTAMEALQGYQFDHKKLDSSVLSIQFAHFPLRLSSEEPIEISRRCSGFKQDQYKPFLPIDDGRHMSVPDEFAKRHPDPAVLTQDKEDSEKPWEGRLDRPAIWKLHYKFDRDFLCKLQYAGNY